jgi:anti-anti-sigma factor
MEMQVEPLPGGAICLALSGRLDMHGAQAVEDRVLQAVAASPGDVLFDLARVSFLSSMGVRLLIAVARTQRQRGRQLLLFGAQSTVKSTLAMVALDQIVPILPNREAALAWLDQPPSP